MAACGFAEGSTEWREPFSLMVKIAVPLMSGNWTFALVASVALEIMTAKARESLPPALFTAMFREPLVSMADLISMLGWNVLRSRDHHATPRRLILEPMRSVSVVTSLGGTANATAEALTVKEGFDALPVE